MSDLIESLLSRLSLRTRVFHQGTHCGDWKFNLDDPEKVILHFVSEGECVVELPEQGRSITLAQGDLLLLPRPLEHIMRASDPTDSAMENNEMVSGLICAAVEFDKNARNPLFEALPDVVVAKADAHPDQDWLRHLLGLLFAESCVTAAASQTVVERLTDILFIHIIRCHLKQSGEQVGILAAYSDTALRPVLEMMHKHPQKPWSIADFAAAANLSRSAFIDKFTRTLEIPPMTYLTQQRLEYAYGQLTEKQCKIIDVALDCGYENESSFSKAFKRMYGFTPAVLKCS